MSPSPSSASSSTSSLVNDSASAHKYMRMGIGGAGNYRKGANVAAAPPIPHMSAKRGTRVFTSGIGGAGNVHSANERSHVNFEEEIARSRALKKGSHQHVSFGIGGAGNRVDTRAVAPAAPSTLASSSSSSVYSKEPLPYGAVDILRRKLSSAFARKASAASGSSTGSVTAISAAG